MRFPILSSGAVAQYGSPLGLVSPAQIVRFVDGSDQRFLTCGRVLRRWLINLRLLNESEIAGLESFFGAMGGEYSTFTFPDPVAGVSVPNCRIGSPDLLTEYQDVDVAATSILVVETNG